MRLGQNQTKISNIPSGLKMSEIILTREQSRLVDQIAINDYKIPSIVLMENAGCGAAVWLLEENPTGKITILCGKGNNGGDGFVIARHIVNHGCKVSIALLADPAELTGDAATNFEIIRKMEISIAHFELPKQSNQFADSLCQSEWIVDALLGTGVSGQAREPFLSAIKLVNASQCKVLAIDVPSGLDCDLGPVADATIIAGKTATFVAKKTGLITPDAAEYTGDIKVIDIGAPRQILERIVKSS